MLLFLDFDGVLHLMLSRFGVESFCYLPKLENVLREFTNVKLVLTSNQREHSSLPTLLQHFSSDIAERFIGVTPVFPMKNAEDILESRHREIIAYLNVSVRRIHLDNQEFTDVADRSGSNSSMRLLRQVGSFSRVSLSQPSGSMSFALAVASRL